MTWARVALFAVLWLGACAEPGPHDSVIDQSERAWQRLALAHADTYWYVESACGAGTRETSVVQVSRGDREGWATNADT